MKCVFLRHRVRDYFFSPANRDFMDDDPLFTAVALVVDFLRTARSATEGDATGSMICRYAGFLCHSI
jgi:hypothetical protein